MARHSLTVQVNPSLPGHVAVVVNEPSRQTYAGFGPEHHHRIYDKGQFDVHSVKSGATPPQDYSSVAGAGQYATFTIPISEAQARAANEEIQKIRTEPLRYNGLDLARFSRDPRICTTMVNRIMEAAGIGKQLYSVPNADYVYLSDIAETLANDPRAKVAKRSRVPIPDELRGIQPDYDQIGSGYDTPSERLGHVPAGPTVIGSREGATSFDDRFGSWPASPERTTPTSNRDQSRSLGVASRKPAPPLGRPTADPSVFDTGASAVPFVPATDPLASQPPAQRSLRKSGSIFPIGSSSRSIFPVPSAQSGGSVQADPRSGRVLSDRLVTPSGGIGNGDASAPGIAAGQPRPDDPFPPIFGLPDPSAASGDDMDDWYSRWVKSIIKQ